MALPVPGTWKTDHTLFGTIPFHSMLTSFPILRLGLITVLCGCASPGDPAGKIFPQPVIEWNPRVYRCHQTAAPISIDGVISPQEWDDAAWTEPFIDIRGPAYPSPTYRTQVKMLWDDEFLYIAACIEEPHVWGILTERDSIIYHDNDFEVFIDPDGDTHHYGEIEMNALGTIWDLLLIRPYRDGGPAVNAWDIAGLKSAVSIEGTLNDPSDRDRGWTVEMALPWLGLREIAGKECPPEFGDQWRINFSRVQWTHEVVKGQYVKKIDSETGKAFEEENWVWSPQGLIRMHYPEMWGIVEFSREADSSRDEGVRIREIDRARWALRQVYYRQREWRKQRGRFCPGWDLLGVDESLAGGWSWPPEMRASPDRFEAVIHSTDGEYLAITEDGRIRRERK